MFSSRVVQSYRSIIIPLLPVKKQNCYASTHKHNYYASVWNHVHITLTKSIVTYMYMRIYSDNILIDKISN